MGHIIPNKSYQCIYDVEFISAGQIEQSAPNILAKLYLPLNIYIKPHNVPDQFNISWIGLGLQYMILE